MDAAACPIPKRVGIVHKKGSSEAQGCAAAAAQYLRDRGVEVILDPAEAGRSADLVLVLGGDGTLIYAAHLLGGRPAAILGVNMGSLGFMTEVPYAQLYPALDLVLQGKATVSERMKLRVHVHRGGAAERKVVDSEVLNEVVIAKGALAPMAELEVTAGGQYVTTYKADGVIVATPTGSTAYSLSVGGPILMPTMNGYILTPISPHTLAQRPMVFDESAELEITIDSVVGDAMLTVDGQLTRSLGEGSRVIIRASEHRARLISFSDRSFFEILREKLHWGMIPALGHEHKPRR